MFVALSKFTVANGPDMADAVKNAFCQRPHQVEAAPGFIRLDAPRQLPQVITLFLNNVGQQVAGIQRAVHQQDAGRLRNAAHMLKAGAGQLGAARLAKLCADLEAMGQAHQLDQAATKIEEFERELEQVKLALNAELSR